MNVLNKKDFENADKRLDVKKISDDEISITNVDDMWDGPLSGSCKWENAEYYFFCFDQVEDDGSEDRWPRKFILASLTPKQKTKITELRSIFSKLTAGLIDKEEYMQELQNSQCIISVNQVVGWFDVVPTGRPGPSKFMRSYFDLIKTEGS